MNLSFIKDQQEYATNCCKFLTFSKEKRLRSKIILDGGRLLNSYTSSAKHIGDTKGQRFPPEVQEIPINAQYKMVW